ncbi:asparagine synthase [Ilyonectria robusta]
MCGIIASCICRQALNTTNIHGNAIGHTNNIVKGTNSNPTKSQAEEAIDDTAGEALAKQLQAGIDTIKYRGPDGSGVWVSSDASVGLAHCRLSIIDPTPNGAQPLHSDDGLIHAVVNGEIYDHDRLREACAIEHGYTFTGHSDSELVVALYKIYGAPGLFEHLRGEFAFVLFDERKNSKRLIAGRDRFGIKPLVWTTLGDRVLFAAEAKAFLSLGWKPEWDVRSITDAGWMIDDRTLFRGVRKVMPGHWIEITDERGLEVHKYWDAEYPAKMKPDPRTIDEMVLGVRERLVEAVRIRLQADVPVGVYLSGGIDSSAVAGIVTELASKEHVKIGSKQDTEVVCFTIRFPHESGYDESGIADRTAEWLGIKIIKKDIDEETLANSFADMAYHSEHHHFDLNSVAKFALSALPREHGIKVVLTGEGSDEHFLGYTYLPAEFLREPDLSSPDSILTKDNALREKLQKSAAAEINAIVGSQGWAEDEHLPGPDATVPTDVNRNAVPNALLAMRPPDAIFLQQIRDQYQAKWDMRDTFLASYSTELRAKIREKWHPAHTAMYMWNKSALINVILSCLGDRAEMAHGIEGRTPFLDHHLAEYVNSLPPSTKLKYTPPEESDQDKDQNFWWNSAGLALRSLTEKWILREAVRPYITDELYTRKKVPFLAPARWPRDGPLHNMFRKLLSPEAVENLGFVDGRVIEEALNGAFGDDGDPALFRLLCYAGSWVVLANRFSIKKASIEESGWLN